MPPVLTSNLFFSLTVKALLVELLQLCNRLIIPICIHVYTPSNDTDILWRTLCNEFQRADCKFTCSTGSCLVVQCYVHCLPLNLKILRDIWKPKLLWETPSLTRDLTTSPGSSTQPNSVTDSVHQINSDSPEISWDLPSTQPLFSCRICYLLTHTVETQSGIVLETYKI